MIGLAYFMGRGVERGPLTGLDWLRKAADQGFAPAQFAVALSFHPGGVEIDAAASFQLLKQAALQRHAPAQLALGLQLVTEADNPLADPEKGPARDLVEGYVWLDLCARHVETDDEREIAAWDAQSAYAVTTAACADARNQLRNKLTPEQTSEADSRALEWMASFDKPAR
jgi:TPR repeat protein